MPRSDPDGPDHTGGVLIALAREASCKFEVTEIHAGRRDRIDRGGDTGSIHQLNLRGNLQSAHGFSPLP